MAFTNALLVLVSVCVCGTSALGTILVQPKSRLVPTGVEVTFKCKFQGGSIPHWNINGVAVIYSDTIMRKREQGFFIDKQTTGDIVTLTLRVNATTDKNGTRIFCSSQSTHSQNAYLRIINESPLSQNPSIENRNASSILLQWSPPYLWPGQAIEYYNISICGSRNNEFHRVDAPFSESVVSFLKTADEDTPQQNCAQLTFGITAVSADGKPLIFTVIGGFLSSGRSVFNLDVQLTVLFKYDRTPVVLVNIVFPQVICSYENLNYSILIEGDNETTHNYGPYQHYGSSAISHTITSGLEGDKEYTLMAVANTKAGNVLSPAHHYSKHLKFDTSLQPLDQDNPSVEHPCTANSDSLNSTDTVSPEVMVSSQPFAFMNNSAEKLLKFGNAMFIILVGVEVTLLLNLS